MKKEDTSQSAYHCIAEFLPGPLSSRQSTNLQPLAQFPLCILVALVTLCGRPDKDTIKLRAMNDDVSDEEWDEMPLIDVDFSDEEWEPGDATSPAEEVIDITSRAEDGPDLISARVGSDATSPAEEVIDITSPAEDGPDLISARVGSDSTSPAEEVIDITSPAEDGPDLISARRRNPARKSTLRVQYVGERTDTFFKNDDVGYSDFHRTRKGGDKRPNRANSKVSAQA